MFKRLFCTVMALVSVAACTPVDTPAPTTSPSSPHIWAVPEPPPPTTTAAPGTLAPSIDRSIVWASWALLNRHTGTITVTGGQPGTSTTESMIKVAVVAQYLRQAEAAGRTPTDWEQDLMSRAIRDSDNAATETLYRRGGRDQMLRAVIDTCQLHATRTKPGWWSETQITAMDAARMGDCLAAGRVCGIEWTIWLLGEMRSVRGTGKFGPIDAIPVDDSGRPLAIKNGWNIRPDGWHVNCLAVTDTWTLAVMLRYPVGRELVHRAGTLQDLPYGSAVCRDVTAAITPPPPAASPRTN